MRRIGVKSMSSFIMREKSCLWSPCGRIGNEWGEWKVSEIFAIAWTVSWSRYFLSPNCKFMLELLQFIPSSKIIVTNIFSIPRLETGDTIQLSTLKYTLSNTNPSFRKYRRSQTFSTVILPLRQALRPCATREHLTVSFSLNVITPSMCCSIVSMCIYLTTQSGIGQEECYTENRAKMVSSKHNLCMVITLTSARDHETRWCGIPSKCSELTQLSCILSNENSI